MDAGSNETLISTDLGPNETLRSMDLVRNGTLLSIGHVFANETLPTTAASTRLEKQLRGEKHRRQNVSQLRRRVQPPRGPVDSRGSTFGTHSRTHCS
eukprot:9061656-Pyramimonas_sp.AAC.1